MSTLHTTLPHNLIKDKLVDLIDRNYLRECFLYIACNDRNAFFTSDAVRNYKLWSCQKVCEALTFLIDSIYIRFGSELYRQIVGIPMGTKCAPLVADLFLFCYERFFDKRDDFDFDIVNFPFLDGVPRSTSYGVFSLNLFVLLECPVMSMTFILVIKVLKGKTS